MSADLEEQREHELAVEEARKLGLENDSEVSKYLCTGKAKVAVVRAMHPDAFFADFQEKIRALGDRAGPMARASLRRPADFLSLTERRRWEIDDGLGILDWDGTPEHQGACRCGEMADAPDLGSGGRKPVRVRFPPAVHESIGGPHEIGANCKTRKRELDFGRLPTRRRLDQRADAKCGSVGDG